MSTFGDLMGQASFLQNLLIELSSMYPFPRAMEMFMEILAATKVQAIPMVSNLE